MKKRIFLNKLKKGELNKPMITWGKLAVKGLVSINIINDMVIIWLLYDSDSNIMLFGLLYLLLTNTIVYKCLKRLGVM